MLQLFVDDLRHFATEILVFDVREQQIHRRPGGFFFAVGMVDQNLVQVLINLLSHRSEEEDLRLSIDGFQG